MAWAGNKMTSTDKDYFLLFVAFPVKSVDIEHNIHGCRLRWPWRRDNGQVQLAVIYFQSLSMSLRESWCGYQCLNANWKDDFVEMTVPISNGNQFTAVTKAATCLQEDFSFSTNTGKLSFSTRLHKAWKMFIENIVLNNLTTPAAHCIT